MQLKAQIKSNTYSFEVILFEDVENEEYNFLIIMADKACMLAQKTIPSGRWQPGSNSDAFSVDLQEAIFTAINTSFGTLAGERKSIDELNKFYIDNLS